MTTRNEKSPAPEQASEAVHQRPDPKFDSPSADPAAETIADARVDCGNGTSSKVRTVWSSNNEDFTCDELDELLDMHTDLTVGDVVFVGEVAPIPTKHLCDADDVIDFIGERAYDEVGEYADGYPDVTSEARAELDALLAGWIEKHAKPTFYSVINVREHVITAADMEGREQ
ncbi:hypothetical protein [Burkholderia multivorans]|uniref:hypothetical protein n=1 Tax=Burkholderia multivorans TaxID=87883 RepID=UPI0020B2CA3E|nr:hypothetical protein [Burkholderia multivorans]